MGGFSFLLIAPVFIKWCSSTNADRIPVLDNTDPSITPKGGQKKPPTMRPIETINAIQKAISTFSMYFNITVAKNFYSFSFIFYCDE